MTALLSELLPQSSTSSSGSQQFTIRGITNLLKKEMISPAVIGSAIAKGIGLLWCEDENRPRDAYVCDALYQHHGGIKLQRNSLTLDLFLNVGVNIANLDVMPMLV